MNHPFKGAGVALATPFTEENEIDFDALDTIIGNQVKGGMDYLVALGTTAETPTLSEGEKKEVVSFIKEKSAGLPIVVGMGGNDTQSIIKQIDAFDFNGVNGILVVTPYYNKPSQEGMFRHYSAIAQASPVPIILYNVPSRTGVNMEAETVVRLAEASERIVAVKEASGILSQITRINRNTPDHFSVISGDDVLALPIMSIGGIGVISVIANALPGKLSSLVHFALEGKYDQARELHFELIDLFKLLFKDGNPGGVKALLNIQGIINNELRSPLYRISDGTYGEIKEAYLKLK
ncbi:4-hydroxy-tetrahydrodipicolinate synthase [Mariniphaga anaerophila]|uniref:4-hydroxy-tetrahydrodipicolinate synthase n=1 Tax=Mariniphaga anaerophila TaxID=1484053 RepID=A0A1M5DF82_9BACT|nr:4-hydroxy-tetrahydrodipicolinate synthase [Mariniphaga anaerophila]SHF65561.1 4-hydroxy-tetrahydrodipicolinate synthase [Mariniphaga anaerophila]